MRELVGQGKPFYSSLDKAAGLLRRKVGTGSEFLKELMSIPGVKQAEIAERGLGELLNAPKMTHEQFMAALGSKPAPAIGEKVLGEKPALPSKEILRRNANDLIRVRAREYASEGADTSEEYRRLAAEEMQRLRTNHMDQALRLAEERATENPSSTYHGGYTLPGGDNYREMLIKAPKQPDYMKQIETAHNELRNMPYHGRTPEQEKRVGQLARLIREIEAKTKELPEQFQGVGAHFGGEPGILASLRLKDRTAPGDMGYTLVNKKSGNKSQHYNTIEEAQAALQGMPESMRPSLDIKPSRGPEKKLLHLEELQSDWHQQGREKGYRGDHKSIDWNDPEYVAARKRAMELGNEFNRNSGRPDLQAEIEPLLEEANRVERSFADINNKFGNAVPNAPFKKNWEEMALKRLIHHAAEKGYHGVVVTPGAEQADRYSLAQHIDSIMLVPNPHPNKETHPYYFKAFDKNGHRVADDTVDEDKLQEYIGKDPAKQLLSTEPNPMGERMVSGANIVTGGEGMKGFYDKKVPNILNSIGKKYGVKTELNGHAEKLDNGSLRHNSEGKQIEFPPEYRNLHYFPITEEMRQDVKKNGIPLYESGGSVSTQ